MTHAIRFAAEHDCETILGFIKELARYEKLEESVVATPEDIRKTLFCENPRAEVLILEEKGAPIGFALYFHNYSTFLGRYGIYIEDVYVRETARGKGYGKALLARVCAEAVKRDCGRVEWWCLDWNTPAIDFYLKLGAEPMKDWTVYRLDGEQIAQVAKGTLAQ